METSGHEVIDLGLNVPAREIIEMATQANARIIALSALKATTTLMKE